jgi:hypothetical protein
MHISWPGVFRLKGNNQEDEGANSKSERLRASYRNKRPAASRQRSRRVFSAIGLPRFPGIWRGCLQLQDCVLGENTCGSRFSIDVRAYLLFVHCTSDG